MKTYIIRAKFEVTIKYNCMTYQYDDQLNRLCVGIRSNQKFSFEISLKDDIIDAGEAIVAACRRLLSSPNSPFSVQYTFGNFFFHKKVLNHNISLCLTEVSLDHIVIDGYSQ